MRSRVFQIRIFAMEALLLLTTLIPTVASASFPGRAGLIVGTRGFNLYTVNSNGTRLHQLTAPLNGSFDDDAAVSPDGTSVLFDRTDSNLESQLYLAPITGGTPTQLTHLPQGQQAKYPVWSPSGTTIYFQLDSQPSSGVYYQQIAAINAQRPQPPVIVVPGKHNLSPSAAPDGRRLAYVNNERNSLDVWDLQAKTATTIVTPGFVGNPDWSPDSRKLAFDTTTDSRVWNVYTVKVDGTNLHAVTHTSAGVLGADKPVWAPDGSNVIAYDSNETESQGAAYLVHQDGTATTKIINNLFRLSWQPTPRR